MDLLQAFVGTFTHFDDYRTYIGEPIWWDFATGETDTDGFSFWSPRLVPTDRTALEEIYHRLPGRFPPLYEELILQFRWPEVDLGTFRLLANPVGAGLAGLLGEITKDQGLFEVLTRHRFLPFGKGPDLDYDPVCFDLTERSQTGDCRVVKISHEEVLCHSQIGAKQEIASGFQSLVEQTIDRAKIQKPKTI